jgi:hypothetical protein
VAPPAAPEVVVTGGGRELRVETLLPTGGSGCPVDLAGRLALVPLSAFDRVRESLPAGCAVLRIDLPPGASAGAVRLSASDGTTEAACEPGSECPVGACAFPFAPLVRRAGEAASVLAIFQSTSSAPRRAALAVELAP